MSQAFLEYGSPLVQPQILYVGDEYKGIHGRFAWQAVLNALTSRRAVKRGARASLLKRLDRKKFGRKY